MCRSHFFVTAPCYAVDTRLDGENSYTESQNRVIRFYRKNAIVRFEINGAQKMLLNNQCREIFRTSE